MKEFDITEEATFDAPPHAVFQALIDEALGETHWWEPKLQMHPTSGRGEVGSTLEIVITGPPRIRWSGRVVERLDDRLLKVAYTEGAFVGEGLWRFEPLEGGGTHLSFRWHVRAKSPAMRLMSHVVDLGAKHSALTREGLAALRDYLARPAAAVH